MWNVVGVAAHQQGGLHRYLRLHYQRGISEGVFVHELSVSAPFFSMDRLIPSFGVQGCIFDSSKAKLFPWTA